MRASVMLLVVAGFAGEAACRRPAATVASALPGAPRVPAAVAARIHDALAQKGPDYVPHTRHLVHTDAGAVLPRYTNRLILESSPYLLQHAHNPVDWRPWGEEAFAEARALGRPVLLSVGYATCHWCHVMERESFEDEALARFLNEHYVCIKVDREQRPDVDATYMAAVQQLTGGGGWPMTVWLTPDKEPFFGGTYFPAHDGDRGAGKGFLTLLQELEGRYRKDPNAVRAQAAELARGIRAELAGPEHKGGSAPDEGRPIVDREVVDQAMMQVHQHFDSIEGGLRRAPKFPSSTPLRLMMRVHHRAGAAGADPLLGREVALTLERMAAGGLHDQLGGGFHRYSTDARWQVPHFEKMLYDNALLTVAYLEGYQSTGRTDFARVATETLEYLLRDMRGPEGGFYSASDADSEGVEGKYFVWSAREIASLLGPEAARFDRYYGVTDGGNFEGSNILHVAAPSAADSEAEWAALGGARSRLLVARARRVPPDRDEKQLAGWNGLVISAFADGGRILGEPRFLDAARRTARFVLERLRVDGRLARSFTSGGPRGDGHREGAGFLEDHAFVIAGLLDLYEATFELEWLRAALELADTVEKRFADREGGWFETPADAAGPLGRVKPAYDGAEPSGPSVMTLCALRLAALTDDARWQKAADGALAAYGEQLRRQPLSLAEMLLAVEWASDAPREIVIVWPDGQPAPQALLTVLRTTFVPARVIAGGTESSLVAAQKMLPLVEGKRALGGKPTAYVCMRRACRRPTSDPEVLASELTGR